MLQFRYLHQSSFSAYESEHLCLRIICYIHLHLNNCGNTPVRISDRTFSKIPLHTYKRVPRCNTEKKDSHLLPQQKCCQHSANQIFLQDDFSISCFVSLSWNMLFRCVPVRNIPCKPLQKSCGVLASGSDLLQNAFLQSLLPVLLPALFSKDFPLHLLSLCGLLFSHLLFL